MKALDSDAALARRLHYLSRYPQGRFYPYLLALFVAMLVVSNTVAVKLVPFGPFVWTAAIIVFPLSYILGDVVTEVYGYAGARRFVWMGAGTQMLMVLVYLAADALPALDPSLASAFHTTLAPVPRLAFASVVGVWCGQFANDYVLSRLKVLTQRRFLWLRTISSTAVGETVDTAIFATLGFAGLVPLPVIAQMVYTAAIFKSCYEALATPLTYAVVAWLKRAEGLDPLDEGIDYSPFGKERLA